MASNGFSRGGGRGGRGGRGRGGGAGARGPPKVSTKLFVGSLPETVRKADLQAAFEAFGEVVECDIVKDYAFVHFTDADEAKVASESLNNTDFQGSTIKVEMSHSSVRQKPGMGARSDCYRCGRSGHWSKDCPKAPLKRPGDRDYGGRNDDDYYSRSDPYRDPYSLYRDRLPPPPPLRRYDPYERRLRDPYMSAARAPLARDPYSRPPPDYYRSRGEEGRDPLYDPYYRSRLAGVPPLPSRVTPPARRPLPP